VIKGVSAIASIALAPVTGGASLAAGAAAAAAMSRDRRAVLMRAEPASPGPLPIGSLY
jgi:hypothetical protein